MSSAGVLLERRGQAGIRRQRRDGSHVTPAAAVADRVPRAPRVVAVFVGGAGIRASAGAPAARRAQAALA
jgi:hypothetical protein